MDIDGDSLAFAPATRTSITSLASRNLRDNGRSARIPIMKLTNPFVLAGYRGPEYFCDRVKETAKLCRAIRNDGNVTLLSPRRYGKTGLIMNAFRELREGGEWSTIYIDIFGTQNMADFTQALANATVGHLDTPFEKVEGAARRIIKGVRPTVTYDEASGQPSLSFDITSDTARKTLEEVFAYLAERKRRTVIAIDEFQQIGNYPEKGVEATLRGFVQFSPVRFVFAGSKQHLMRDMFASPQRPFFQSTTMMPLGVIDEEPYYAFAGKFFRDAGRKLDRKVFAELYRRFDGITWYLQAILWDFYASGEDISDVEQLEDAISQRIDANEYDEQRLLELLPDGARRLLKAIALEGSVAAPQSSAFVSRHRLRAPSSVKTSLDMLLEKELVYRNPDGYVVYDRFLAEYLRRR